MRFATIMRWQCLPSRSRQSRQTGRLCASATASPRSSNASGSSIWVRKIGSKLSRSPPRAAPALRGAETTQRAIVNAGLGQVSGELVLGEPFLARDRRSADVEHELDPCLLKRADEGVNGPAFIANSANRLSCIGEAPPHNAMSRPVNHKRGVTAGQV